MFKLKDINCVTFQKSANKYKTLIYNILYKNECRNSDEKTNNQRKNLFL